MRISDDPRRFTPGARLLQDDGRELVVETAREHGTRLLVRFQGIETRAQAVALRGPLYIRSEDRRELEESEFWEQDIVGSTVADAQGNEVGVVADVTQGAAHDLLVVSTARGEKLVPMVKEIVVEIDVGARRVVIDPPEGLLD